MSESRRTVIVAILANAIIAVAKYAAGIATGSAAMLAEAIHSTVDTGNEALMLLGLHRSQRPPDEQHPFGHGPELYFWSLVVAIVIFGFGGGAAILEGIWRFLQPKPAENLIWSYVVLSVALLFEAISWTVSFSALRNENPGVPPLQALRASKDPSRFVVVLEDSAAIVGVLIALVLGTWLDGIFPGRHLDAIASMLIGVVLVAAATFLIAETRGLLIGESADPQTIKGIRNFLEQNDRVGTVKRILTMQLAPEDVLLNVDLSFRPEVLAGEVPGLIESLELGIRERYPEIKQIFLEAHVFHAVQGRDP